ncbi:MAG TPA: DNA primase [Candidatus Magasanikbacteria bacterium]|nr:DNA primase [Candidatus Magasanikbacteria bacterium]
MADTKLIKEKVDIVDLISEYVALKPAGVNHKGLCPFHREKSPSFMVSRERQSWHCFGCSKGGDIFSFVQEIEGMEFSEALKYLANRAGVPLDNYRSEIGSNLRNRIKEINENAANFFHNFLLKMPAAASARDYLSGRKVKPETITEWLIGYVPDQWDLLTNWLTKKGFAIDDLVASGLTIKKADAVSGSMRGYYDRFRGRVMFPIWDTHGSVVGFTGRVLVETENSGGKYVNTPVTPVYDKSSVIFGLNRAKSEIKTKDLIVVVEGQMDTIACHEAGMKNVVASSGTAMTETQVKLLKRYSQNLALAFDMDAAGIEAAERGILIALREGMNVRVIRIPDGAGKDPDECLKKNPEIWFQAVKNAEDVMAWFLEKATKGRDLKLPKEKQMASDIFLPKIALVPYAVERDYWLQKLAETINVGMDVLREDLPRFRKNPQGVVVGRKQVVSSVPEKTATASAPIEMTRSEEMLEMLFALLLRFPKVLQDYWGKLENIAPVLSTSHYANLYFEAKKLYNKGNILDLEELHKALEIVENGSEMMSLLGMKGDLLFQDFDDRSAMQEAEALFNQIHADWLGARRKQIQLEMISAEKAGDKDVVARLMNEFIKLV